MAGAPLEDTILPGVSAGSSLVGRAMLTKDWQVKPGREGWAAFRRLCTAGLGGAVPGSGGGHTVGIVDG